MVYLAATKRMVESWAGPGITYIVNNTIENKL